MPPDTAGLQARDRGLRLQGSAGRREGQARPCRLRLRRRQVRPDERPDVGRRAPAVEALHAVADRTQPGQAALDVAGGTGDIAAGMARQVGERGLVVLSDINEAMLGVGRNRLLDRGLMRNVRFSLANAECLPFADESFDCVTIAFACATSPTRPRHSRRCGGCCARAAGCWCSSSRSPWCRA